MMGRIAFVAFLFVSILAEPASSADLPPGTRISVAPDDLPPPYASRSVSNAPQPVERPRGAVPRVPSGFAATLFAERLGDARNLAVAPDGEIFLAESQDGRVTILRDNGQGRAGQRAVFAEGLETPYGIAFHDQAVYIADLNGVWRYPYRSGEMVPGGARRLVSPKGAFGEPGGHSTRNIVFSPDGHHLYAAIGSSGNIAEEAPPRADILEFDVPDDLPTGGELRNGHVFASGLRNPVGLAFPAEAAHASLFAAVNERDGLGDGLVPDYLTHIETGGFYGWPYAYIGQHKQPGFGDRRPDLVAKSIAPDLLFRAHSAPLGLAFYAGAQFPAVYHGDAFVALHGSWNSAHPTGYCVVRVPFRDGKPAGFYEIFASGFWVSGEANANVWGRPAGIAVAKDGSLLVADDVGDAIWRIAYVGGGAGD